jgi:hypothetical protein
MFNCCSTAPISSIYVLIYITKAFVMIIDIVLWASWLVHARMCYLIGASTKYELGIKRVPVTGNGEYATFVRRARPRSRTGLRLYRVWALEFNSALYSKLDKLQFESDELTTFQDYSFPDTIFSKIWSTQKMSPEAKYYLKYN